MNGDKNSTTKQQPKPAVPLKARDLERLGPLEGMDFLRESGTTLLIGVGLAVAVFLGFSAYRNYKKSATVAASALLFNARTTEHLQSITSEYGSTPAAPLAYLSLAAQHFDDGQYELAQYAYVQFEQKFSGHEFQPLVDLGKAQCMEAMGQYDDALALFAEFERKWPDHYLQPMVVFGKARCYEQVGRFREAKVLYEDFLAANPTNRWAFETESAIQFVEKEMRARGAN
jgi:tetratricopeptide (TPR) repeat protein